METESLETVEIEKKENESDAKVSVKKAGFLRRNWSWLLAMAITALFMLIYMIFFKVAPFGTDSFTLVDSIHQYVPFLSDYRDKLLHHESLLYTWDVGMGQNFQSLFLYYMASPLNLIIVFFTRKGILAMFSSLVAVKIVISAGAFGYMLRSRNGEINNSFIITALSLCYSLSAYICGYYWNIMWLDCIMVFPLIILGFERLMQKNDPRLYAFALFYSMFCNYYISFIICVFLVLWFLAAGHKNFKGFITDGLKFAGCSILAAAMAGFSLLMAYLAIMKTSSAGSEIPEWSFYQSFYSLLKQQYMLSKPVTMDMFDGNANLFCGTICYIAFFVYIFAKNISLPEKIRKVLLIVFLLFSMNQEKLNFIWHGFHNQYGIPNRFSFLYIFTLIYISYDVLKDIREVGIFGISLGAVVSALLLGLVNYKVDIDGLCSSFIIMIVSFSLITMYSLFLLLCERKVLPIKGFSIILFILVSGEIMTNAWFGMADHGGVNGGYYTEYSEAMEQAVGEVDNLAKEKGQTFYRSEVVSPIMLDENTYNNMKSVGTFCTTVRGNMVDTMGHMGLYTGANEFLYLGSNQLINDILGVRYVYLREGDYFPSEHDYKTVYNADGVRVIENTNAMSIGYGVNGYIDTWNYDTRDSAKVLNDFCLKTTGVDDILEEMEVVYGVSGDNCEPEYSSNSPNLITYSGGNGETITIFSTMVVPEDGRYLINMRGNYIENITYYLNDEYVTDGRYQTQLFDLGELRAGDIVRLDIEFNENYSPEGSVSMFLSRLDKDKLSRFRGEIQKHEYVVSSYTDNSIVGSVNLEKGQILLTTIPYDEGWTAYVDGEKKKPEQIGEGLMGLKLDEGEHVVELRFVPEGMITGLIISAVGWLIYIALFIAFCRGRLTYKTVDHPYEKIYNQT